MFDSVDQYPATGQSTNVNSFEHRSMCSGFSKERWRAFVGYCCQTVLDSTQEP